LRDARSELGAIDFDTTETRIVFNEEHKVERIVRVGGNDAHRLSEECMLAANVAAARFLLRKKLPALFRNHDGPQAEKLLDLKEFLGEMGLRLPGSDKPTTRDYAELLDQVRDRPDSHLIQTVLLRSLSQAVYSAENQGHFGLSFPAYSHFTSPIRRYPDLIVHRAIRHLLNGGTAADFDYSPTELQGLGEHCSATERRADEATRDVTSWLKCEYMMDKIGEEFAGIITSVTSFGIFVELDDIFVDGLVHITALDNDYYHFDPVGHRLTGERSGMVYRLGDRVRIKVAAVNLDDRKLDFTLVEAVDAKSKSRSRTKGASETTGKTGAGERAGNSRRKRGKSRTASSQTKAKQTDSSKSGEQLTGRKRGGGGKRRKPKTS